MFVSLPPLKHPTPPPLSVPFWRSGFFPASSRTFQGDGWSPYFFQEPILDAMTEELRPRLMNVIVGVIVDNTLAAAEAVGAAHSDVEMQKQIKNLSLIHI